MVLDSFPLHHSSDQCLFYGRIRQTVGAFPSKIG